ncbi:MAG TPA: type II toxin-antitoxin system Phd/YefM family antitoxin [Devosia sp.]
MKTMQARDAKARFSELLEAANSGEATTITRHGVRVAVLMPVEEADKIYQPRKKTIGQVLLEYPGGIDLESLRDHTPPREIDL